MWHRILGNSWNQIKDTQVFGTLNPKRSGTFESPQLTPGQIYEVRIYDHRTSPGRPGGETRFKAKLHVFCLLKDTESKFDFVDELIKVGGTYREHILVAKQNTFYSIVVSKDSPIPNPNPDPDIFKGFPNFPEQWATDDILRTIHHVTVMPLDAGNTYNYLIRLSDDKGNWQVINGQFITKQRKVTIDYETLYINDDGDNLNTGEAYFLFRIFKGEKTEVDKLMIGNKRTLRTVDDTAPPWNLHNLNHPTVILGPESVNDDNRVVWIHLMGVEDDSPFQVDEVAASIGPAIYFPFGPSEEVYDQPIMVPATTYMGTFNFSVEITHSIEYI
ncbi:hypothetical protein [Peribacillus sp. V2I11]|uniref:hypothetical protein n=1 Tax=Peribacillus sp. V2I11 TaxID=3042277 RepID=UPI00278A4C80|nr:hypothetical protein [Peribacillus sp. V2I11]MDQ0884835.1 hypothetical protein [Peribacillus sp. V2I11]